jgi:hypothetical protein
MASAAAPSIPRGATIRCTPGKRCDAHNGNKAKRKENKLFTCTKSGRHSRNKALHHPNPGPGFSTYITRKLPGMQPSGEASVQTPRSTPSNGSVAPKS